MPWLIHLYEPIKLHNGILSDNVIIVDNYIFDVKIKDHSIGNVGNYCSLWDMDTFSLRFWKFKLYQHLKYFIVSRVTVNLPLWFVLYVLHLKSHILQYYLFRISIEFN